MIREGWERLRETVRQGVEWVRREYRFHEQQLAEASLELEKRRDSWEWWGDAIALWVALLLPTFIVLSPYCSMGQAPPESPPVKRETPTPDVGSQSATDFVEKVLNGRTLRSYLSELCSDETASDLELPGGGGYPVETEEDVPEPAEDGLELREEEDLWVLSACTGPGIADPRQR